jgi:hypothetical protein
VRIILEIPEQFAAGLKSRVADFNAQSSTPVDEAGFLLAAVIPLEQWAKDYPAQFNPVEPIDIEQTTGE